MAGATQIEWTDYVWNVITGCSKVSDGCKSCYAEGVDKRFAAQWGHEFKPWTAANATHNVRLHNDRLDQPLRWKRSRRIFVNSMSDLFHEQVPDTFIIAVFRVMAAAQQHTFQILTKRPERMASIMERMQHILETFYPESTWPEVHAPGWPLPNVWLGVSVEHQKAADERIPLLLQTPAAIRFLSMEPLLGAVDLLKNGDILCHCDGCLDMAKQHPTTGGLQRINWVIAGSESGPNRRPCDLDWIRSIRDQCITANIPFFLKQLYTGGHKITLPLLDGQRWEQMPGRT